MNSNNLKINIYTKTESELIHDLVKSSDNRFISIVMVLKGLASIIPIKKIIKKIPLIGEPIIEPIETIQTNVANLLPEAFASVISGTPAEFIKNKKLICLLQNYYNNIDQGNIIGLYDRNKNGALTYFNDAYKTAFKIDKYYQTMFDKKGWISRLLRADSLSHIGSINTELQEYEEGNSSHNNSLAIIDQIQQGYGVVPIDRILEINSYLLSNELRNINKITSFIGENKIQKFDDKYTELIDAYDLYASSSSYASSASSEILHFIFNNKYLKIKNEINLTMQIEGFIKMNHHIKFNKALGKYYTIRGCYDLIKIRFNEYTDETILSAENQIIKGLDYLSKSLLKDDAYTIEKYLQGNLYSKELQKDLGRNYALLFSLGVLLDDPYLQNKYLDSTALVYKKEQIQNRKMLFDSIDISFSNIASRYGINVNKEAFKDYLEKALR